MSYGGSYGSGGQGGSGVVPTQGARQTGDGSTTTFASPAVTQDDAASFIVTIEGVVQRPNTDYTVTSNGSIQFDVAPDVGAVVDILYFKPYISPGIIVAEVERVAWKPVATPPQYQIPDVDNVGKVVSYTDETAESGFVSVDLALGEFTVEREVTTAEFLIAAQVIRDAGGGTDQWGLYFETYNPLTMLWEIVEDSTRFLTFDGSSDDEIRHISYTVATNELPVGAKFRIVQICSDVSDGIGLVASKPFANAPLSAGIVVSIQTTGYAYE